MDTQAARIDQLFEKFAAYDEDVRCQETAKRALTLAAAGAHNLLRLCPVTPILQ